MEQATGIEPAFQAWEARILTIELCLQNMMNNIIIKIRFKYKKKELCTKLVQSSFDCKN